MRLIYYDEVKYDPPKQPYFWLGGISVQHDAVPNIEKKINDISYSAFGSRLLQKKTEFHGIEICRGSGNFKGREFRERLVVLESLLDVLSEPSISPIFVRIIPANIKFSSKQPDEIAFMYFVEQVDKHLDTQEEYGMLFGDYDEPAIGPSVASLSKFRKGGTYWTLGRDIVNLVDTVHFAKSHHSRLIQLADVYLYCRQFYEQNNNTGWRRAIEDLIADSGALRAARSKVWPQQPIWFGV